MSAVRWSFDGSRFNLKIPHGVRWTKSGRASLTFLGLETFIGKVTSEDDSYDFTVERVIPQLPMMQDPRRVLQPDATLKEKLLARLSHETARRGQPVPTLPAEPPALTRLALHRRTLAGGGQPMATMQK